MLLKTLIECQVTPVCGHVWQCHEGWGSCFADIDVRHELHTLLKLCIGTTAVDHRKCFVILLPPDLAGLFGGGAFWY